MQKWILCVLCIMMITFFVPQSIYGEGQKSTPTLMSLLNPSYSLRLDTFDWMEPCIEKCQEKGVFENPHNYDSLQPVERGDFIRWLVKSKNIPLVSSGHEFVDVDKNDPNYKYIQTAVESGIIEKTSHFYPADYLLRYVASIWLVNAMGEEAIQKALSYTEPVIPAQDGYYEVPQEAIGSMTVCYLPAYQLMNYRYTINDWYRQIHPRQPLLFGEAAYSYTMMMNPPKMGSKASIAIFGEPTTLFPGMDWVDTSSDIVTMISPSTLPIFDYNWCFSPELLKRIPTQENGLWTTQTDKNGEVQTMEVTFELRQNLLWSDGTPITVQDIVFALYFYNHPETYEYSNPETRIEKVEIVNPLTVRISWNEPYLYPEIISILPHHYFEEKYNYHLEPYHPDDPAYINSDKYKQDTEFIQNCILDEEYCTKPILAGPYCIEEWNAGRYILLKPNPYYLFDTPVLDEIQLNFRSSPWEVFQDSNQPIDDLIPIYYGDDPLPSTHRAQFTRNATWEHIDLNVDVEPLNDRNVRKALMLAIDRDRILEEVFNDNEVILSNSWLSPKHLGSQQYPLHEYSFDRKEAERLLDNAGWIMDPVTKYREKDGEIFTITFMTTSGNISRESVQDIITECWEDLGIEVIISNESPMNFFTSTLRERRFDGPCACMYAWVMSPYSNLFSIVNSNEIPTHRNEYTGQNYTGFSHDLVDHFLEENYSSVNKTEIYENLNIVQEILLKELPSLPLHNRTDLSCLHKDLMNYKPCGSTSTSDFWNIAYWYWK
jgi:peptide/nickel transport system substrate-binding protein